MNKKMAKTEDLQICVRRLKEMFLSGNTKQQMRAAKMSLNILTKDVNNGDYFLQEDIVITLAEAMAKMHNDLLKLIMQCLELLASRSTFYCDKHATYITDCLLRILSSCIKRRVFSDVFHMAVKLLSRILASFEKWSSPAALDTCVSVERILLIVMQTLQNLPEAEGSEVVLSSGRLLCGIVGSKLTVSLVKTVFSTINAYMEHVLGLLPDSVKNTSGFSDSVLRAAIVINNIFSSSLRMFSSTQFDDTEVKKTLGNFQNYVLRSTAIFLALPMKEKNAELLASYMQMLKAMYDNSSDQLSHVKITNALASQSFLRYLFEVSYWASGRNDEQLKKMSLVVLGDMLYVLSVTYLPPVDEPKKLKKMLMHGLKQMSCNPVQLRKETIHFTLYYTIMIYLYFLILCFFRNPFIAALSQHLLAYRFEFCFNTKLSVKALWLIVAALCLSPAGDFLVERNSQRSIQLIEVFEKNGRSNEFFHAVYTHHPALLAWAFCCVRVPSWLQMKVLTVWLISDDFNNGVLLKLLIRFPVVGCFLLDIIVQSDNKTAERSKKIIHQCLVSSQTGEQVLVSLWNSLPTALSCFDSMSVPNAGILMSLACQGIPDVVNASSMVQVAWNLTRVLPQYDSSIHFYGEGFRLSSLILITAQKLHDKRVMCMYLSNVNFLETTRRAVMSESSYLMPLALQLLTSLLGSQSALCMQSQNSVILDGNHLLAVLLNHSWSVVSVSQFIIAALSTEVDQPCVKIADFSEGSSLSPEFIKTLYFKLQGFCATSLPSTRVIHWGCLEAVLRYCSAQNRCLAGSLVTQPWHHKLIQFAILSSPDAAPHVLQFCLLWLRCYQQYVLPAGGGLAVVRQRRYSLALRSGLLAQTLAHISTCIQHHATHAPAGLLGLVQELQEMVLHLEKSI